MSIAFRIFLFIFFCKPFSYRMSNETLHHGATSNSFGRRHRGYVFSLHAYAAGPLSTFPSFIHLKHNTGGVILGEFGFCFYFKLLPAPQRCSKQSPFRALGIRTFYSYPAKRRKNCAHDFQPRYPHRKSRRNISCVPPAQVTFTSLYAIHFPSILACCMVLGRWSV